MKTKLLSFAVLFLLAHFISCQRSIKEDPGGGTGGGGNTPPQTITTSISGRVIDQNKIPLSGVQAEAGGRTGVSDINGNFTVANFSTKSDLAFVKVTLPGYFTGIRTISPSANATNNVEIILIKKVVIGNFASATGGAVPIPSGGNINFPANSLINAATNTAYNGNVQLSAFFINPTAADFRTILPGDLRGLNSAGKVVGLQSFGMMAVELNGASGEKLQLATGKQASITFPIPASLNGQSPSTIPLWYMDETTGLWKEEGSAQKQGSNYVGSVSHFSFWNCDSPYPTVNFSATLQDQQNRVLSGARVVLKTSTGIGAYGMADADGKVQGLIPANEPLKMIVTTRCGSDSTNIGPFSKDANLGVVHVNASEPAVAVNFSGTVSNCTGSAVTNGVVNILMEGINYRANVSNGTFTYTAYRCDNSPVTAQLLAFDLGAGKQSNPTNINVTSGTTNAGQITACNTLTNYISFSLNSTSYLMTAPADSVWSEVAFTMQTQIKGYNADSTNLNSFVLGTLADRPITTVIDMLNIRTNNISYAMANGARVNLTLTEFGTVGQFIAGNFTGTIRDSTNHRDVSINCNFRVRRR